MKVSKLFFLFALMSLFACEEGIIAPETSTDPDPEEREITYEELSSSQFHRILGANAFFSATIGDDEAILANETGYCFQAGSYSSIGGEANIFTSTIRDCSVPELNPSFILKTPSLQADEINAFFEPGAKNFATIHTVREADGIAVDLVYKEEVVTDTEAYFRLVEGTTDLGDQSNSSIEIVERERYFLNDKEEDAFVDLITLEFTFSLYDKEGQLLQRIENGRALVKSPYYSL